MKNLRMYSASGIPQALSNLLAFRGRNTVADLTDAVEDSCTGTELLNRLHRLDLSEKVYLDRETPTYVRIRTADPWGNTHYLQADKF